MKAIKATLKPMLTNTLSGEKPTIDYYELCTILVMAANVANDRPVALRSRARDDLVPLTVNQRLSGNTAGAPLEPQVVLDKLYFGASRYRQVLVHVAASIYLPAYTSRIS